jgi:O-antigen/teichoic acid export membrane protein
VLFIPFYGIIGAAWAYAAASVLISLVRLVEVFVYERIHPYQVITLKPIMVGMVAFCVVFMLDKILFSAFLSGPVIGVVLFVIIFFGLLWLLKFDDDDKFILNVLIRKVKKKV